MNRIEYGKLNWEREWIGKKAKKGQFKFNIVIIEQVWFSVSFRFVPSLFYSLCFTFKHCDHRDPSFVGPHADQTKIKIDVRVCIFQCRFCNSFIYIVNEWKWIWLATNSSNQIIIKHYNDHYEIIFQQQSNNCLVFFCWFGIISFWFTLFLVSASQAFQIFIIIIIQFVCSLFM